MRKNQLKQLEKVAEGDYLEVVNRFITVYFKVLKVTDGVVETKDSKSLGITSKFIKDSKNNKINWPRHDLHLLNTSPLNDTTYYITKVIKPSNLNVDSTYIIE